MGRTKSQFVKIRQKKREKKKNWDSHGLLESAGAGRRWMLGCTDPSPGSEQPVGRPNKLQHPLCNEKENTGHKFRQEEVTGWGKQWRKQGGIQCGRAADVPGVTRGLS